MKRYLANGNQSFVFFEVLNLFLLDDIQDMIARDI